MSPRPAFCKKRAVHPEDGARVAAGLRGSRGASRRWARRPRRGRAILARASIATCGPTTPTPPATPSSCQSAPRGTGRRWSSRRTTASAGCTCPRLARRLPTPSSTRPAPGSPSGRPCPWAAQSPWSSIMRSATQPWPTRSNATFENPGLSAGRTCPSRNRGRRGRRRTSPWCATPRPGFYRGTTSTATSAPTAPFPRHSSTTSDGPRAKTAAS
mmetsp:Transcript_21721/g.73624  ORF Transcript_21721/g.73624 Transcript_21721/m.73624 type:complete len:214 (-) Transcript_21721:612-1253(-)